MNQVNLIGRMTKDAELSYTQSGMAVARFSLALDRGKDKDGNSKGTDFPSCVAFGKTAENLERYSGKGLKVALSGHIQTGKYDDRNGTTHYTTDIIADKIEFLDWKERGQTTSQPSQNASYSDMPDGFAAAADDIPF